MSRHVVLLLAASVTIATGCSAASSPPAPPESGASLPVESASPTAEPTSPPPPPPPSVPEQTPNAEVDAFLAQCDGVEASGDSIVLEITAQASRFDTEELSGPVHCQPFTIVFHNLDFSPTHNVAILLHGDSGLYVFWEPPFQGPQDVTYEIPPLPAGDYTFLCVIHPERMRGALTVAPE